MSFRSVPKSFLLAKKSLIGFNEKFVIVLFGASRLFALGRLPNCATKLMLEDLGPR